MWTQLQHKLERQDQLSMEEELSRRACIAGFSMSPQERKVLESFLKEMCHVFRGVESEWIMVDGVPRDKLKYLGDGIFNTAHKQVLEAMEEKKRAAIAVYAPPGAGKTYFMARMAACLRKKYADALAKLHKDEAEAAAKKAKKKPAAAAVSKPAPAAGAPVKKKEAEPKLPPAQTRVVSFFKSPWHSLKHILLFLMQEVWGPIAATTENEELQGKDLEMRARLTGCAEGQELSIFNEGLLTFFALGLNETIAFVLDGLTVSEVEGLAASLKTLKETRNVKLFCMVSVCTLDEDDLYDGAELLQPVKIPVLSRPEATVMLYATVKEYGPHLLRKPIAVLMRVFKGQSSNPRYLQALTQLVCAQPLPKSLTGDIDDMGMDLDSLYLKDLLPFLETQLNPDAALFPGVSSVMTRGGVGTQDAFDAFAPMTRQSNCMQPVERVLRLLYDAGEQGLMLTDVQAVLAVETGFAGVPDRVLFPLLQLLRPHLHRGSWYGEERIAMLNRQLRDAVRQRYWPSALVVRGTGCQQMNARLRPLVGPLKAAFGKTCPKAPIIIIDVENGRRLDTVKRLLVRFLLGWSAYPLQGAAGAESFSRRDSDSGPAPEGFAKFNILSCQSNAVALADTMVLVDQGGQQVSAAIAWLNKLGNPLVGGLGIHEKESNDAPISRIEWPSAIEHIAAVGKGCDHVFLFSDRTPAVSVERIMDEVQQLNSEMGSTWKAAYSCVSLDAPAACARMLRRVAHETQGKFSSLCTLTLRQQLFWDWDESEAEGPAAVRAGEEACGCLPPPGPSYVPVLAARDRERERNGKTGHDLVLEGGRSVVLVVDGDCESHLGGSTSRTERGLRVTVFDSAWTPVVNKTFDTWGSVGQSNALALELSRLTPMHTVIMTSFDAWERCFNHAAAQELSRCGIDGLFFWGENLCA